MYETAVKIGDAVTVRKGALLLPEGRNSRRLLADARGKVVRVLGRTVQVEADGGWNDADGLALAARYLTFDQSYVYRRDAR